MNGAFAALAVFLSVAGFFRFASTVRRLAINALIDDIEAVRRARKRP
jgi:hypothetical protein